MLWILRLIATRSVVKGIALKLTLHIKGVGEDFVGVFIRAPHIVEVGEDVEVLSKHNDRIVAARQGQFLGCSFHPELTDDHRMTAYFVEMVKEAKEKHCIRTCNLYKIIVNYDIQII